MTKTEFYHKQHIQLLSNHLLENDWVRLYKRHHTIMDGVDEYYKYFSYLATPTDAAKSLRSATFDIQESERVALMGDYSYRPFVKPGFENLVTVRNFSISNEYFEDIRIAEELIFYFRLFEDRGSNGEISYYKIEENSKTLVCVVGKHSVKILNRYLVEFMAAKRMDLVNCCQSEIELDLGQIELPFKIECTNNKFKDISPNMRSNYELCVAPHFSTIQSWFNGKTFFNHTSLKQLMEKKQQYISYIIGTDSNGEDLISDEHTNPYTPIFFKKEVQSLYASCQGCKIEPLRISTSNFSLRCDNDNQDFIVAFLRDIQDLPYKDQYLWKVYNTPSDGRTFSDLFQKTIIEGNWNGVVQSIDFVFRDLYQSLASKWEEKYDWKLLNSLNGVQSEYYNRICLLNRDNDEELNSLVKYLAISLQESLNSNAMKQIIPTVDIVKEKEVNGEKIKEIKPESSISHFHRVCERLNVDDKLINEFLKNLQSLRSYMLHRNANKLHKDTKKAFKYFGLKEDLSNSQLVSYNILSLGAKALSSMIEQL